MGLFDKLLKSGVAAVASKAAEAAMDVVNDAIKAAGQESDSKTTLTQSAQEGGSFDAKLASVLKKIGEYEVRKDISPDILEQESGAQIYTRGGCYCKPNNFTYSLYQDGKRVLIINLWDFYQDYKHFANREIREYCAGNGIKMLDFFDYLPNEIGYMEQRISEAL